MGSRCAKAPHVRSCVFSHHTDRKTRAQRTKTEFVAGLGLKLRHSATKSGAYFHLALRILAPAHPDPLCHFPPPTGRSVRLDSYEPAERGLNSSLSDRAGFELAPPVTPSLTPIPWVRAAGCGGKGIELLTTHGGRERAWGGRSGGGDTHLSSSLDRDAGGFFGFHRKSLRVLVVACHPCGLHSFPPNFSLLFIRVTVFIALHYH